MWVGISRGADRILTQGTSLIVIGSSLTLSRSAILPLSRTATRSSDYHE